MRIKHADVILIKRGESGRGASGRLPVFKAFLVNIEKI
jgi:hypothetical protein